MKRIIVLAIVLVIVAVTPVAAGRSPMRAEDVTGVLGDINGDGYANSTDVVPILWVDAGVHLPPTFEGLWCPMQCGDVNSDGYVNSTDALIILSFDGGIASPWPLGEQVVCPALVTPPPGCVH
jgi:hypothetical protein